MPGRARLPTASAGPAAAQARRGARGRRVRIEGPDNLGAAVMEDRR
ncbi:hypothetical protein [Rubrobacter xylanophilus]|nr:hypothetical protein [Rubrobacter xylanophilus]